MVGRIAMTYNPDDNLTLEEIEDEFYPHQVDESEAIDYALIEVPPGAGELTDEEIAELPILDPSDFLPAIQHNDPGDETDAR